MDKPRCKYCKQTYAGRSDSYMVQLKSMYIRMGRDGKEWIKVGYYCPKCKRFYKL